MSAPPAARTRLALLVCGIAALPLTPPSCLSEHELETNQGINSPNAGAAYLRGRGVLQGGDKTVTKAENGEGVGSVDARACRWWRKRSSQDDVRGRCSEKHPDLGEVARSVTIV